MSQLLFFEDKRFKYRDEIVNGLKKYNESQAGFKEKDRQNFYVFDDES